MTNKRHFENILFKHSGIYIIENIITKDAYIGQAINMKQRIIDHRSRLHRNKHNYSNGNPTILQSAWNKYGEENFRFSVLEYCDTSELNNKEKFYINKYQSNRCKSGHGYNMNDGGAGQKKMPKCSNKGKKLINNGIEQKYVAIDELDDYLNNGYVLGSMYHYQNQNPLKGIKHPHYGKKWTEEHRKNVEETYKNRKNFTSPLLGQKWSKERKEKMRYIWDNMKINQNSLDALTKNQEQHKRSVNKYTLDNIFIETFDSIKDAAKSVNGSSGTICSCCKGDKKYAYGYKWKYKEK